MIKVTNIAPGPRGIHAAGAIAMLQPGQTADLDVAKADLEAARRTGWFTFEGDSAKDVTAAYDTMNDDELRAVLKDKGVAADGRWSHERLVSEAKKAAAA